MSDLRRIRLSEWPHWPWTLLAGFAVLLATAFAVLPSIPQPLAYHQFADTRSWLGIPRFGDVASNAAILLAGLAGLLALRGRIDAPSVRILWSLFFGAIALTALGSTYYHWAPDSARLVWDRLPLALATACFPALVLAERATLPVRARLALAMWLALGPLSVLYWALGDADGLGDLRPYGVLKVCGVLGFIAFLALLPPRHTLGAWYVWALVLLGLAGPVEALDAGIYTATGWISGHTLKHLLAALGVAALARMVAQRRPVSG